MSMKKLLAAAGVTLLVAVSGFAQEKPGNIAGLEFQKPKNGMVKQYEEGRKAKVQWHKAQKDTQPLMVWQVISGENTGTYIVGRVGQHWADMDKPSVPDQADLEEYTKVVAPAVESMTAQYYAYLPKDSKPLDSMTPAKYSEVIIYHARQGKGPDFRAAITKTTEAISRSTTSRCACRAGPVGARPRSPTSWCSPVPPAVVATSRCSRVKRWK